MWTFSNRIMPVIPKERLPFPYKDGVTCYIGSHQHLIKWSKVSSNPKRHETKRFILLNGKIGKDGNRKTAFIIYSACFCFCAWKSTCICMYLLKARASYFPFHFPPIVYTQFTSVAIILKGYHSLWKADQCSTASLLHNTIVATVMTPASVTSAQKTQIVSSDTVQYSNTVHPTAT